FFTYLSDAGERGSTIRVVVGNPREMLEKATDRYDMVILDNFDSNPTLELLARAAVQFPLELLTREAFQLYRRRLADDGVLICHFCNQSRPFRPLLENLARHSGLVSLYQADQKSRDSHWVVMARRRDDVGKLAHDARWEAPKVKQGGQVWTYDSVRAIRK